jgi:predicted branched-subunit amino acid permease
MADGFNVYYSFCRWFPVYCRCHDRQRSLHHIYCCNHLHGKFAAPVDEFCHGGSFPGCFTSFSDAGVTDESFAVNMARFNQGGWNRYSALVLNHVTNATWIVSTVAGCYVGQFIPAGSFGIDYALTGMFICLLVFQLRGTVFAITALIAAFCSVLAYLWLPGNAYVIVSSCLAATAGFAIKRAMRHRKQTT